MEKKEEIKANLEKFINDIIRQDVLLKEVHFSVNKDIIGVVKEEGNLRRDLRIKKLEIASGVVRDKETEGEFPFVEITYYGSYKDTLILEKNSEEEKEDLFKVEFIYSILITLVQQASIFQLEDSIQKEIFQIFAETTGKLIIFPYIRYLVDFLAKSGGITVPPIPPIPLNRHGKQ